MIDLTITSTQISTRFEWKALSDLYGSDHFPIVITTDVPKKDQASPERWLLQKANWSKFQNSLKITSHRDSIEEEVENITNLILNAARKSIPTSGGTYGQKRVPWWNQEVQSAIKAKKAAFNRFKRYPTDNNLLSFKKARAKARRLILKSKRVSWSNYVSEISSDTSPHECWNKVRRISGRGYNPPISYLQIEDGVITHDTDVIAARIADHFERTSSSSNYDPVFLQTKEDKEQTLNFQTSENFLYNTPFNMIELNSAMSTLRESSPGPDSVSNMMLSHLTPDFKRYLLSIYNKIWVQGSYPDSWKEAIVVPILKANKDPLLAINYRPISLTSCLGKLLEKMVNNRLVWLLETGGFIVESQSGFRKFRSTIDQIVYLEHAVHSAFSKREHLVAVFFDLKKAYDMTWRYHILRKLYKWGFRGNLPLFITSFLENRKFRVRTGTTYSSLKILENGVPQGSTLSVTLFLIAVNDLVKDIDQQIGVCLYVDDLSIFYAAGTIGKINTNLQAAINQVAINAENIGFQFSIEKTQCMHFCRLRRPHYGPMLRLKKNYIQTKDRIKFLGLILEPKLTWTAHIKELKINCLKRMNIIKVLAGTKWGAEPRMLLQIYSSLILSKIDYGCVVYSSASHSILRTLDSIHHMGIRLCLGSLPGTPSSSLCVESGLAPLNIRRKLTIVSYACRQSGRNNNRIFDVIFKSSIRSGSLNKPLSIRLRELLIELNYLIPPVLPIGFLEIPPWKVPNHDIVLDLLKYNKQDTPSSLLQRLFLDMLDKYTEAEILYTDGSKTDHGVGAAFVVADHPYSWTLPPETSVFTAEQYALWQALHYCSFSLNANHFVIATDALSVLLSLSNPYCNDPLLQRITSLLVFISEQKKNVHFIWVPSHTGLEGNEIADKAARQAAGSESIDVFALKHTDFRNSVLCKIYDTWQNEWNSLNVQLKLLKSTVRRFDLPKDLSRQDQTKIHRLRIGYTLLTHNHRLYKKNPPICDNCQSQLSVPHIVVECLLFTPVRQIYHINGNLSDLLSDPERIRKVIMFLKACDLYNKI